MVLKIVDIIYADGFVQTHGGVKELICDGDYVVINPGRWDAATTEPEYPVVRVIVREEGQ